MDGPLRPPGDAGGGTNGALTQGVARLQSQPTVGYRGQIPALTGLRGIGAVWVLLYHLTEGLHIPVLKSGYLGVDLFFILSGFVLTMVYADSFVSLNWQEYLRFLQVRLARIYPLYLATLLLAATLVLAFSERAMEFDQAARRFSLDAFIACLLLIQNWAYWLPTSWNLPSWSLSAEWLAYLLFPVAIPMLRSFRTARHAAAAAGFLLVLLCVAVLSKGVDSDNLTGSGGTLRMVCEFGCGAFLCQAMRNGFRIPSWTGSVAAIAVLSITLSYSALNLLTTFGFALVVVIAAAGKGPLHTALSSRPVVFLGDISYSIYLLHWIVIEVFIRLVPTPDKGGPPLLLRIITCVTIVLCLAWVSYRVIELPARRWGRSLGRSPVPVGAVSR
jgi:peptidoglycan/LPS O-acetylase OafA/YrhL